MRHVFMTVLIERNVLLREGLLRTLNTGPFRIVGAAGALNASILDKLSQPCSALLVIGAVDDQDTTAGQIALFKEKQQSGRVVVVADTYEISDVLTAFRAGANAYFVKVRTCATFIKCLELVMLGETIVPSEILSLICACKDDDADNLEVEAGAPTLVEVVSNDGNPLSPQEKRILHFLGEGDSNKLIARKLDIAEATVKVHVKAILRKIRVRNRTQAVVWAMQNNFLISRNGGHLPLLYGTTEDECPSSEPSDSPRPAADRRRGYTNGH